VGTIVAVISNILVIVSCSPMSYAKQSPLNRNMAREKVFQGVLPALQQSNQAVMGPAIVAFDSLFLPCI
jgi:hypothetical protein